MTPFAPETAAVFKELMAQLAALEEKLSGGPVPLGDEQSVLEGYKWIFSIAQVALDVNVWADATRPRFVDIVGPYKKWGGDNVDAFYQYAPIDPTRTYRVRGRKGDAVYLSLTVYGGPDDGRYSERIVGTVNDRMLEVAADGRFEITLSPPASRRVDPARARRGGRHHARLPDRRRRPTRRVADRVPRSGARASRERR